MLRRTRKLNLDIYDRLKFWKKYGKEAQKELNTMKSTCTKQTNGYSLKGKVYTFIQHFSRSVVLIIYCYNKTNYVGLRQEHKIYLQTNDGENMTHSD